MKSVQAVLNANSAFNNGHNKKSKEIDKEQNKGV